jgi:surface polysaccharide O-acyltransferase-like enzyme
MEYDVIRVIALLMIVMVHVSAYVVIFFPETAEVEWLVGNFFNGLARAGVPMFVMLSGALLLKEDKPFDAEQFYKRNFLTMVLLTIVWMTLYGLFYAVGLPMLEGKAVVSSNFWQYLLFFKGSNYPHLWYMFMAVGLYMMVPVLRLFVKRENKSYIIGIIIASMIFEFCATTADFFSRSYGVAVSQILDKFYLGAVSDFIGLILLGWYFSEFPLKESKRFVLYVAGIFMVTLSTWLVYLMIDVVPNIRDYVYEALTLPAFVYAAALYVLLQSLCKQKLTQSKLLTEISDCSFGIYLVHVMVLEIFVRLILPYEQFGKGKPLSYIMLSYATILLVSFAIVKLIGYIRGMRKIFFLR